MSTLFGYRLEPDFDLAKENRRDRLWWPLMGGAALWGLYLFFGSRYAAQIFQGLFATILFYGENFYVQRWADLRKRWLWVAIVATIPVHVLYLTGVFWADDAFPNAMAKAVVFLPVLAVGFCVESFLGDKITDFFKSPRAAFKP